MKTSSQLLLLFVAFAITFTLCYYWLGMNEKPIRYNKATISKPLKENTAKTYEPDTVWINAELLGITKQNEFKRKMDISEARYDAGGKDRDYKAYYIYRDSLIKWIKFKDSVNLKMPK